METFAKRLKWAIERRGISQAEAAKKCGIAQQSMNYIINKNLKSSKLSPKIATVLGVNLEWLISGRGRFEEIKIIEVPLLTTYVMLQEFLKNNLDEDSLSYTFTQKYLGQNAFAYLLDMHQMVICSYEDSIVFKATRYLSINKNSATISQKKTKLCFPVYEWRVCDEGY